MQLQKEQANGNIAIKSYKDGEITLNSGKFNKPIFLANGEKVDFPETVSFEHLTLKILENHLENKPEILIIGSGKTHKMLPLKLIQDINKLGVAIEVMASRPACHTYQVLAFDRRQVFALIYP